MLQMKVGRLCLAIGWFLSSLTSAWAREHDDGDYLISHARYGTAQYHVDVTERLRQLASRDRLITVSNRRFGIDPHPDRVKTLRVYARSPRGEMRVFEYLEGDQLDGSRFRAWRRGDWGRERGARASWNWESPYSSDDYPSYSRREEFYARNDAERDRRDVDDGEYKILQARYGTAEFNVDVTHTLKQLARADRRFRMGNASFGVDPHPYRVKTLRIFARGSDGRVRVFEYREGSMVDGGQFKGWSRGEWGQGEYYSGAWEARQFQ